MQNADLNLIIWFGYLPQCEQYAWFHHIESSPNRVLSVHVQTSIQSTSCVFLMHCMGKWKLNTIVHALTFCSSPHQLFWDTNRSNDFCSYLPTTCICKSFSALFLYSGYISALTFWASCCVIPSNISFVIQRDVLLANSLTVDVIACKPT